jgi:FkbM family methyltransferase
MDLTPFINKIDDLYKNLDTVDIKYQIAELDEELNNLKKTISIHQSELQWIDVKLGLIGEFRFPLLKQGERSTIDVFCVPDLVLFLSYYRNRMSKNIFIDIGANIGLHSLVAKLCGYQTISFEPDPDTFLVANLFLEENSSGIKFINSDSISKDYNYSIGSYYIEAAAAADFSEQKFVKLLDNPYGNHIKGYKQNVYGNTEEKIVKTIDINSFINKSFTAKLDAEGSDSIIFKELIRNPNFHNYSNTIYLCDWRDETRHEMYEALQDIEAEVNDGISKQKISSLNQTPANKSYDFLTIISQQIANE